MPLHYVLICPEGTPGWSIEKQEQSKGTTMMMFYRQIILRCVALMALGRLLNEFCVDIFSCVEEQRLSWIRHNQSKICRQQDLQTNSNDGRVFLPASFIGSFRHNQQMISDALAIVSRLKNPTYFITFTCNPNWPEITSRLLPGQNASDRPEIVTQVFKAKLKRFQARLPKYFAARKIYKITVVEFQTRGLPHAHIAVKMSKEPTSPDEIDQVISAELPDDPLVRQKVQKHMIHKHYPDRCYRTETEKAQQKCHYKYPKPANGETYINDAGYPQYRRRHECDQNVVPYNRQMLQDFDCHINVELAASVTLIMYLYKYLYKGFDYVDATLSKDETKVYIHGRYLSASEAVWRMFGYELTRREPAVSSFPVHLENQNYVVYNESNKNSKESAKDRYSKLDRYFARPKEPLFEEMKYLEYYEQFTVTVRREDQTSSDCTQNTWYDKVPPPNKGTVRRRTGLHITRMEVKRLQSGEVWYLRLLLQNKPARSFSGLRTLNDITYPSYSECARAMGLLEETSEAEICMDEAKDRLCSPRQLRFLFIILITEGGPALKLSRTTASICNWTSSYVKI